MKQPRPVVWTIAGADSSCGAGISADLMAFDRFETHGCTVITTSTAQNSQTIDDIHYLPAQHVQAQLQSLKTALPPVAIKLGLLGDRATLAVISQFLQHYQGISVFDPVCNASVGTRLLAPDLRSALLEDILPYVTVLTPNLDEAAFLLNQPVTDLPRATQQLRALGPKTVIIKGGHARDELVCDTIDDGKQCYSLQQQRVYTPHQHGTGCAFASALAANLALDIELHSAIVCAKAYVQQGLMDSTSDGHGPGSVAHSPWPVSPLALPWRNERQVAFPKAQTLGIYAIVDNLQDLQYAINAGINSLQLRIKTPCTELASVVEQAIILAQRHKVRLYINDHWQLALRFGAYGVHLGQDDLQTADLQTLQRQGLYLGISCHTYHELAIAHTYQPSYIGFGPLFKTSSKNLAHAPQGLERLKTWCQLSPYPIVAIGGITVQAVQTVFNQGAAGVALLSNLKDYLKQKDDSPASMMMLPRANNKQPIN